LEIYDIIFVLFVKYKLIVLKHNYNNKIKKQSNKKLSIQILADKYENNFLFKFDNFLTHLNNFLFGLKVFEFIYKIFYKLTSIKNNQTDEIRIKKFSKKKSY